MSKGKTRVWEWRGDGVGDDRMREPKRMSLESQEMRLKVVGGLYKVGGV